MSTKFFPDGRIIVGPNAADIAAREARGVKPPPRLGMADAPARNTVARSDTGDRNEHVRAAGHANVMTAHACEMNTKQAHEAAAEAHEDMAARHRLMAAGARKRT